MRQFLFIVSILFLATGCATRKPLQEHQARVKFNETGGSDYLSPNFQRIADTTYVISLIVRARLEPTSEIVTEKLSETDKAVMELENSLVRNNFRVIDRPVYHDLEAGNPNITYPFDFIIEILEMQSTKHFTGIKLTTQYRRFLKVNQMQYPHYLEGRKMLVKIINAKNGEVAALVNCEYVPCRNGCKIKYNDYEIIEITTTRGKETEEGDPENKQYSDYMATQLSRQVADFIKLEMYRYKRKIQPK